MRSVLIAAACKSGCSSDPACVAAHGFHHRAGVERVEALCIAACLHGAGSDKFRHAAVARAVVRESQVIVHCFGHAHHDHLVAELRAQVLDLGSSVHGVVAACVEKVADIVSLEHLEHALVVRPAVLELFQLVAAASQGCARGCLEHLNCFRILGADIEQLLSEHPQNPVIGTVHTFDQIAFLRLLDHPAG